MKIKSLWASLIFFSVFNYMGFCQNNYELLFLKSDYAKILSLADARTNPDDYYWLSVALNKQGKIIEAIKILEDGRLKFKNAKNLELTLANLYFESGQYASAKPILHQFLDNTTAFLQLLTIYEYDENYLMMIELLKDKLSASDSLNIQCLKKIAETYYQMDSIEHAINAYNKVLMLNPNDIIAANKLANIYYRIKKYESSINVCNTILRKDSLNKKFIKTKALASFAKGDFRTSDSCFKHLYNLGDTGKIVNKYLGIIAFSEGKFIESRKHLNTAYLLDQNDFETCFYLGKAYYNSPSPKKGLFFFDRVDSLLQPKPSFMSTLFAEKQAIYNDIGDYHKALECYQIAYKYNPKPEYLFFIASIYQNRLASYEKALEYYQKFLQKLPLKVDYDDSSKPNQTILSLRKIAEDNIVTVKEELFFQNKLKK